jgi:hypothetical protein
MSEQEQMKEVMLTSPVMAIEGRTLPRQEGYDRTDLYQTHDRHFSTKPTQKKKADHVP